MPVLLTDKERALYKRAKEFSVTNFAPNAARWEEERCLPPEAVELVRKNGFFGIGSPVELGGLGYNYLETALTYEGLAYGDGGFAFFIQLHNNIAFELATFYETTDTVKKLVPEIVRGEKLTAFALTDDDGGSDPFCTTAYAEEKEDCFHLFGEKSWVSNSVNAEYFSVFVKDGTPKGMVMLLVHRDTPGFEVKEDIRRIGGNVMSCGRIKMDNVIVSKEYLISRKGFKEALRAIDVARIFVPAIAVGVAQRAIDITAKHLATRCSFGTPILSNQAAQFDLAELTAEVEAARWLAYHTASVKDSGANVSLMAAKNKLFGPDVALRVTTRCGQWFGAKSCEYDSEITRCINMARTMKILDGSTEMQKIVLGREIEKNAQA